MSERTVEHHTGVQVAIPSHIDEKDVPGYVERVVAEAEARQADERALIKTIGKALIGVVALGVAVVLVFEGQIPEALGALGVSLLAFGIVTWEQVIEWRGLKK